MSKPGFGWLIFFLITVLTTWLLNGYLLYGDEQRGTFGDMFGAVNALFSGLAFAGIIYTILLQRTELELQREELRATRQEMARSALAQEKSEGALQSQVLATQHGQKLAAINNMLEYAHSCHHRLQNQSLNTQEQEQCLRWSGRRYELNGELDKVYNELIAVSKPA